MKSFEEQLHTNIHTAGMQVSLSSDDKDLMREKVVEYMSMKPMRARTDHASKNKRKIPSYLSPLSPSPWSLVPRSFGTSLRMRVVSVAVIAGMALSGAGVSHAAESALPGDLLYPVKIGVNEEVEGAFIFSDQSRIEWLARRAERRLEEAGILSSQGKLDAEKSQEVAAHFETYTNEIKTRTQALETDNPQAAAQVSTDVSTNLEAHEAILARLAVDQGAASPQATELVGQVRTAAKEFAALGQQVEDKLLGATTSVVSAMTATGSDLASTSTDDGAAVVPTASGNLKETMTINMRVAARTSLDRAYSLLTRITNQQSDSALRTKESVDNAEAQFTQGQEALAQNDFKQAYSLFKDVYATGQKISRMLDAEVLFQIDILPSSDELSSGTSSAGESSNILKNPTTINTEIMANTRARAEAAITDVSALLLEENNYPSDIATRATNLLKDAKAFKLRGDIAIVTHDTGEAQHLFKQAADSALRARALLQSVPKVEKETQAHQKPIASGVPPASATPPSLPTVPDLPPLDVVQLQHLFANGVHTFTGVFYTPTKCFTLTANATAAASDTKNITLSLTAKDEDQNCPQFLDAKPFSIDVPAAPDATVTSVMLNGTQSKFVVQEGAEGTTSQLEQ